VLLVYTARPEFRLPWPLRAHHVQLTLSRLNKRQAREMVGRVAPGAALRDDIVEAVVTRTDGVPLFVEELTKAVVEAEPGEAAAGACTGRAPARWPSDSETRPRRSRRCWRFTTRKPARASRRSRPGNEPRSMPSHAQPSWRRPDTTPRGWRCWARCRTRPHGRSWSCSCRWRWAT